jgi:hypothetical protein
VFRFPGRSCQPVVQRARSRGQFRQPGDKQRQGAQLFLIVSGLPAAATGDIPFSYLCIAHSKAEVKTSFFVIKMSAALKATDRRVVGVRRFLTNRIELLIRDEEMN